jgi:hypothetical protein
MASELVATRLPRKTREKLRRLGRRLGAKGDSEALRRVVETYPEVMLPSEMPALSKPLRSRATRRSRLDLEKADAALYP